MSPIVREVEATELASTVFVLAQRFRRLGMEGLHPPLRDIVRTDRQRIDDQERIDVSVRRLRLEKFRYS